MERPLSIVEVRRQQIEDQRRLAALETGSSVSGASDLGTFNPAAVTLDNTGYYDDYTVTGNLTLTFTGTPVEGSEQIVPIYFDGTYTLTKPLGSRILANSHIDGGAPSEGSYLLVLSYNGGRYNINLITSDLDTSPLLFSSAGFGTSNTYVDVVLSKPAFGANDGITPAALSDFSFVFAANGGTATNWTVSSIKQADSAVEGSASALAGGETTIRVFGSITGTPDGNETLTITPADGASLYDALGVAMDSGESISPVLSIIYFADNFTGTTLDTAKWTNNDTSANIAVTQNEQLVYTSTGTSGDGESTDSIVVNGITGSGTWAAQVDIVSADDWVARQIYLQVRSSAGNTGAQLRVRDNTGIDADMFFTDSAGTVSKKHICINSSVISDP